MQFRFYNVYGGSQVIRRHDLQEDIYAGNNFKHITVDVLNSYNQTINILLYYMILFN